MTVNPGSIMPCPATPNAKRLNALHAAAIAHDAIVTAERAALASAALTAPGNTAPVSDAIPVDPSAADVAPAVTAPIPMIDAIPPRPRIGSMLAYAAMIDSLSDAALIDGRPINCAPHVMPNGDSRPPRRSDPALLSDGSPLPVFTSGDLPRLLAVARRLVTDGLHVSDADAFAVYYLSNRTTATNGARTYFASNRVSDLDRIAYSTRGAERLLYRCASLVPGRVNLALDGGYNGLTATLARRSAIAAVLASAFPHPAPTADATVTPDAPPAS